MAVALESGRLWAQVQQREAARTEWISRIIAAQEDERRRIAHELHDEGIQALVLLCRQLDTIRDVCAPELGGTVQRHMEVARGQVEGVIATLRTFTSALRPPVLDALGLAASLRRLLADTGGRTGMRWDLHVRGALRRLPPETELGLYRIAQEAVRNVERHAGAARVEVDLAFGDDAVSLRVVDDGKGFNLHDAGLEERGSFGILGMRERAGLLGGMLAIASRPGQGTTVTVTVPSVKE